MRLGTSGAERARLATLERYGILDSEPEQAFDDLAKLAAVICDASAAQINFIDSERQWTKASVGAPRDAIPRDESICAIAINPAQSNYWQLLRGETEREKGNLAAAKEILQQIPPDYDPDGAANV